MYIYTFICLFMDWLDLVAIACTCRGTVSSSEAANKKKAKKLMLLHDFFQATLLSSNVSFSHSNTGKSSIFMEVLNGQTLGTKWGDCQLARSLLKPEANQQKPLDLKLLRFYQQNHPSNWPKADHNHPLLFANKKGRYQPEHNWT